jgi:hypothetical protein
MRQHRSDGSPVSAAAVENGRPFSFVGGFSSRIGESDGELPTTHLDLFDVSPAGDRIPLGAFFKTTDEGAWCVVSVPAFDVVRVIPAGEDGNWEEPLSGFTWDADARDREAQGTR